LQNVYQQNQRLFLLPIGGTAMASLAGLLQAAGHHVEGVDSQVYPPMSTLLSELGIPVRLGFSSDGPPADVDRVIIGNAVPRANPEVQAVLRRGLPHLSQAEAVAHYILARGLRSLVVAGTHGKTTTTSMLAWILESAATDPSYLIGGLLRSSGRSFRLGRGELFVIEGDEYNTAFFDRGPKFLHYRPHVFLLGPVEFDHADIYRDLDAVLTAFRVGSAQVPSDGTVIVSAWSDHARDAVRDAAATLLLVGADHDCALRLVSARRDGARTRAELLWQGLPLALELEMAGLHNLQNAAMALAGALVSGVAPDVALDALARFPGVARRLEVVGEAAGVTVVDDFAHHPTALAATIAASRERWPGRRLLVAFEPRSLSAARRLFQGPYEDALATADVAMVTAPFHRGRLADDERIDRAALARSLGDSGVETVMPAHDEDPVDGVLTALRTGDVVLGCSSGDFGDFHRRLLARLAHREDAPGE